jgi:hypothetical protein
MRCGTRILGSFSELELATTCTKHAYERILVPRQRRDGAMSKPPYRALRVVLGFLSLVFAIGGTLIILSSKP